MTPPRRRGRPPRPRAGGWPGALAALLAATEATQRQLAARLGVGLRTVEDWHAGRRTPKGLYRRVVVAALREAGIEPPAEQETGGSKP